MTRSTRTATSTCSSPRSSSRWDEQINPEAGLGELLDMNVEQAARKVLQRAEELLGNHPGTYSEDHAAVVRSRVGWSD